MSFMLSHHFLYENVGIDGRWMTSFLQGLRGTISPERHYCSILVCAARQTHNAVPAGGLNFGGQTLDPIPLANCGLMPAASFQFTGSLSEKPEQLVIRDKIIVPPKTMSEAHSSS